MTDTFSFNITLVAVTNTNITIRFLVLDNTFFTRAKVHYLVLWNDRTDGMNGEFSVRPPPDVPDPSTTFYPYLQTYHNIEVLYGCTLPSTKVTSLPD
jgi:hypothetical protein